MPAPPSDTTTSTLLLTSQVEHMEPDPEMTWF
jgi:hypothetical protein